MGVVTADGAAGIAALHDLDPEFRSFSRSEKVAAILESLHIKRPLPVQSMYIFKVGLHTALACTVPMSAPLGWACQGRLRAPIHLSSVFGVEEIFLRAASQNCEWDGAAEQQNLACRPATCQ